MDAPERGALTIVRIIAGVLILWTLLELALYWAVCQHNHTAMKVLPCLLRSLPLLAGVVVLAKARALAEWISNILDN